MNEESGEASPLLRRNPLKDLWAVSDASRASNSTPGNHAKMAQLPLGWILGSAAIILIFVIGLLAYLVFKRSEDAMANLLAEKGSSLIVAFESALKSGMRGQAGLQLQVLLEEMTQSPDIVFVALTMPDGIVIAHSDRTRIGETLFLDDGNITQERLRKLAPGDVEKWLRASRNGHKIFLIYRRFTLGQKNWPADVPKPTIFLGMDVAPFEITSSQNRSYVTILSIVTMLVGLACLLALSYAQRAAESGLKQRRAEGEVHRLEEEVRRNEKLAAVGTLAAGVAHEIRNPLSSIKGYATYFMQRFPEGSEDREAATVMVNEVDRLNRVITDLLGLSRPSGVNLKPVCVENVVAHVMRLLRQNAARKNVAISCRLAPHIPEIYADMERLSQALLNLCLNSLEAMRDSGQIVIAVSGGRKRICLMVCDDGAGIGKDIMEKIFDPYFTTKGTGTGLGLPMVHKIISEHGGEIGVKSRPAQYDASGRLTRPGSTVFHIWLKAMSK